MRKKDYRDYLQDILYAVHEIEAFIKGMTFDAFRKDRNTVDSVIRCIEVIGESADNTPQILREKYSNVPWKKMAVMKEKLIHEDLDSIDLNIVWHAITKDIPSIKPLIADVLDKLEE